jgi:hypothetical protein
VRKFTLYVVALLAVVGASVAYAAASPSAKLQKQDRVYGGGQFGPGCFSSVICFANPRNLAVDAHAQGDGTEAAGNSTYGSPSSTFDQRKDISCLRVDGNRAVIGGTIQSGPGAGDFYAQYFVDRGGPSAAPGNLDLVSPSFEDSPSAEGWPAGFPSTCPSPTAGFPGGEPVYLELDEGDIVVSDAPSD